MFIPLTVTPLAYPCYILIVLIAYLYYNLCAVFKSLHTAIMFVHNAHALLSTVSLGKQQQQKNIVFCRIVYSHVLVLRNCWLHVIMAEIT